jgi:site-specific recombinase XerD
MAQRSKRINLMDDEKLKKVNPETLELYRKYEMDMTIRELSPKSIYNYKLDLYGWFIYILENQGNACVKDITEDDIVEFIYHCKIEGNNSRRIKRRLASISAFYKYLRRKKRIEENPMEFIERPKKDTDVVVQTFLTKEQVELMKQKLIDNQDLQLRVYILLSLSTMGRVNAIANIKWEQIDFGERTINDVLEKEGKIVTLYFNEEVKELLYQLKIQRMQRNISNDYVFLVKYGNEWKQASVSALFDWCKKVGLMINIPTLHPHDFRHSGATLLKNAGMSLEDVSEFLNHNGTDVTRKFYIKADKSKMQKKKDMYEI